MRKGGGKSKGHQFENKIANILTDWSGFKFRRTPKSGGWDATVACGDIFLIAEHETQKQTARIWFPLSIECKCAESWEFVHFFTSSDKSPLWQWWQQASDDAEQSNKLPVLIFTRNWLPNFIMLRRNTLNKLAKLVHTSWKKFPHINLQISKSGQVTALLLDDFLAWIDFQTLLKLTV